MAVDAQLVEGVAGSGKSTYIAQQVAKCLDQGPTLLLSFSQTGKEVLDNYTHDSHGHAHLHSHTIDHLALRVLERLGDDRTLFERTYVLHTILPKVVAQASQTWFDKDVFFPSLHERDLDALLKDLDFFRVSLAHRASSHEEREQIVSGQLNYDVSLVAHVFAQYETSRYTLPPYVKSFYKKESPLGFKRVEEACGDLLGYDESQIKMALPIKYRFIFVDEFHDVSPMQMAFIKLLLHDDTQIVAVGDRFQNIFSWRGTNTDVVFEDFKSSLNAKVYTLNQSYRFGQSLAELATQVTNRPTFGNPKQKTKVSCLSLNQLCETQKKSTAKQVLIAKDYEQLVKAAFDLYAHQKEGHKMGFALDGLPLVSLINVLYALQTYHWVNNPKNAKYDVQQFLDGSYCYLSPLAKKEILERFSPQSLEYYLTYNLETKFTFPMRQALKGWIDFNAQSLPLAQAVSLFLEEAQYFKNNQDGVIDRAQWLSWQRLRTLMEDSHYGFMQWPELYAKLNHAVNMKTGLKMLTVSQAKGKEFDKVIVYGASPRGFEPTLGGDTLARNQFYVAITRAKKQLDLCLPLQVIVDA